MEPTGEFQLKFIVPHPTVVEREVVYGHCLLRHLPDPRFLFRFVPGTPVVLVHGGAGRYTERHADTVHVQYVLACLQYPVHIVNGHAVLYLIVHVEHSNSSFQPVPTHIVQA